jgi:hypothetical protein
MQQAYEKMMQNIVTLLREFEHDDEDKDDEDKDDKDKDDEDKDDEYKKDEEFNDISSNLDNLRKLTLEDKTMETRYKKQAFRLSEMKLIEEFHAEKNIQSSIYYQRLDDEMSHAWTAIREIHEEISITKPIQLQPVGYEAS